MLILSSDTIAPTEQKVPVRDVAQELRETEYLWRQEARDDAQLVQRAERAPDLGARDFRQIHGRQAGEQTCVCRKWELFVNM